MSFKVSYITISVRAYPFSLQESSLRDNLHVTVENYLRDQRIGIDQPTPAVTCPYHPQPVPLPSPLPASITKAITNVTELLKLIVNETHAVSMCLYTPCVVFCMIVCKYVCVCI